VADLQIETSRLRDAVRQIKQSYEWKLEKGGSTPFFFVVGAGVSAPQVPLAAEIVRYCKEKCGAIETPKSGTTVLKEEEYSHWLNAAFHAPEMRQDYFRKLIHGKPISTANFRLAHLLLGEGIEKPFATLVATTNFDNFLSRALNLFGKEHVLCDSPSTAPRLDLSNPDRPQIIHVHGNYQFYDIKNLSCEVRETAKLSDQTIATMAALLDSILRDRSPIVVGYGGWEGDVFMKALKRRLRGGTLPQPLYWCCYHRDDWCSLPEWLRKDPNVRFVEPDPKMASGIKSEFEAAAENSIVSTSMREIELPPPACLAAQTVFDELIRALAIPEPGLTRDPVGFFADQLGRSLPTDEATAHGSDPYGIKSAVDEMRVAANWVAKEFRPRRSAAQQELHRVREYFRVVRYFDAIASILEINLEDLNQAQLDDLLKMALEIVESATLSAEFSEQTLDFLKWLPENATLATQPGIRERVAHALVINGTTLQQLQRFSDAIAVYDEVVRRYGEASEPMIREQAAWALMKKAVTLCQLQRSSGAIAECEEVVRRYGEASEPGIRQAVAWALLMKGVALVQLQRFSDVIAVYEEVVRRCGEAPEPGIRELVARALVIKGMTLRQLQRFSDAIAVYDEVVRRYGEASEPVIREQVAGAVLNKGVALRCLGRSSDEIAAYEEVVGRFGEASEPGIREAVARALVLKGSALSRLGRSSDEIAAYQEVVRRYGQASEPGIREAVIRALVFNLAALVLAQRFSDVIAVCDEIVLLFGEASEPEIRELVAGILFTKGVTLGKLQCSNDALASYEEVVRRYGQASEPGIRKVVGRALNGIGFTVMCHAKASWRPERAEEFVATLREGEEKIQKAIDYLPDDPFVLGNQGYLLFLQGKVAAATEALRDAIRLGGEELRKTVLANAEISLIPMDDVFSQLVRNIPDA
jgi:tetratricopeptide (TPR) repeat protein